GVRDAGRGARSRPAHLGGAARRAVRRSRAGRRRRGRVGRVCPCVGGLPALPRRSPRSRPVQRAMTTPPVHLVISALGPDRVGLVADLTAFLHERGVNLEDSRMAILGGEFGMMALVSGSAENVARVERELESALASKTGAHFLTRR